MFEAVAPLLNPEQSQRTANKWGDCQRLGYTKMKHPLVPLLIIFALAFAPLLVAPKPRYQPMSLTPEELAQDVALCEELGGYYGDGCQPY
jgi:hypothetical protein